MISFFDIYLRFSSIHITCNFWCLCRPPYLFITTIVMYIHYPISLLTQYNTYNNYVCYICRQFCDAIDYLHGNFTYYVFQDVNKKATFISHPVFPYLSGRETIEKRKSLHIWMLCCSLHTPSRFCFYISVQIFSILYIYELRSSDFTTISLL